MMRLNAYFDGILRDNPEDCSMATSSSSTPFSSSSRRHASSAAALKGERDTITKLLSESFAAYPHITREIIDKMRLHQRLAVVQRLEDTQKRNVLRSIGGLGARSGSPGGAGSKTALTSEELTALFDVVKNEQLGRANAHALADPNEKHDPSKPYYELYKVREC